MRLLLGSLTLICSLLCVKGGFYEYLTGNDVAKELTLSKCVAVLEDERLKATAEEAPEGTLFLPTNDAWNETPKTRRLWRVLMDDNNASLREDLVLEVGSAAPGDWDELVAWTSVDGMLEAASSSLYFLHPEEEELCYAVWSDSAGDFEETKLCAKLRVDDVIVLENESHPDMNQHIYMTNKILLNPELEQRLMDEAKNKSPKKIKDCSDV